MRVFHPYDDFYAGADPRHLHRYPNEFMVWKILEWGRLNRFTLFDFGGAGHPDKPYGPREFKRRFGGDLVNFGRFALIHQPFKLMMAKKALKIWKLLRPNK